MMKKIKLNDLTQHINNNKTGVEKQILETKHEGRTTKMRPRDQQEIEILDEICKRKIQKAIEEGKLKFINKRKWYYEFD
jgi:hypothetical protein